MTPNADYVTFPRTALFEFFGSLLPSDVDCAPIAERIIKWVESHDLTGAVIEVPPNDSSGTRP
jgi:hypothetical protein